MMKKSLFLFVSLIVLLVVLNNILQKKLEVLLRGRPQSSTVGFPQGINVENANPPRPLSHRKHNQSVVRRDRLSPGRDYIESIFYLEDAEVARQKIVGGKVVEMAGKIPDGKVKFVD